MQDLPAYLARIGAPAARTLPELHRAHASAIPFENLDPASGRPVRLETGHLEDKLVGRRRGGYCFEQNLLLKAAIEALDVGEVTPMLARVRVGSEGRRRPPTHLVLKVVAGGTAWHADVGFGVDGLLDPIPFGPGGEHEQCGFCYRVVEEAPEWVLQIERDGSWLDLYGFVPEPAVEADIEMSNWFVSTHPRSPFVTGLFVACQVPGEHRMLTVRDGTALLSETSPRARTERRVGLGAVAGLLASQFGLEGVALGPDGLPLP